MISAGRCPIANDILHVKICLVIKEYVEDQRECHLSVNSSYKNFHHRCAHRFNLTLLITVLRCSSSAISQMSDIHIRIHWASLKEEEKNFFDANHGRV